MAHDAKLLDRECPRCGAAADANHARATARNDLPDRHSSQTCSFSTADIAARRILIATFVYEAANRHPG